MRLLLIPFALIQVILNWSWQPWPWDPFGMFDSFFLTFILFAVVSFIIFIVVFVVIIYFTCRVSRARHLDRISTRSTFDVTTLPRRKRKVLREQLPRLCLECDAPLKYNEVKWTGPHQAECPYCGHTVTLELVETTIYD